MDLFKELFGELAGFKSLREAVDKNISPVSVTGLSHIHRMVIDISPVLRVTAIPLFIFAESSERALL